MTKTTYWKITIPPISPEITLAKLSGNELTEETAFETPEELGGACWALGADGVTENPDGSVQVFITGDEHEAQKIGNSICQTLRIKPLAVQMENNENWVQRNAEVLKPITCGEWSIRPIAELPATPLTLGAFEIAIVPGMGFGTGHHTSTQLALSLLIGLNVTDNVPNFALPNKILDIGTGSGILAVASNRLWPSADIIATDNDPQALTNARDTIAINNAEKVTLTLGTIPCHPATSLFDVITANLYAECLRDLEPEITSMSHAGTWLIQSGVLSKRVAMVKEAYTKSWRLLRSVRRDEWNAYLWEKQ